MTADALDPKLLDAAITALAAGELVVIPTETVYGLAADATNGTAVARVFELKRRAAFNPLICHVADLAMAASHGVLDPLARRLAKKYWPGPLTLVVPLSPVSTVHRLVTAGLPTIALRRPVGVAAEIIERFGRPLAAPSANPSGWLSPTRAEHVRRAFGDGTPVVLDTGPCRVGIESTIVAVGDGALTLLRPGAVTAEDIEACAGQPIAIAVPGGPVAAPGMLKSHYAPRAHLRLDAADVVPGEALLAFGAPLPKGTKGAVAMRNLSPDGDLVEAAANLFSHLDDLDRTGAGTIAVMPIPETGLGVAINDRLRRGAAPRESVP